MNTVIIISLRELAYMFEKEGKFVLSNFISFEEMVNYILNNDSRNSRNYIWNHIESAVAYGDDLPYFYDQIEIMMDLFDEKLNMFLESFINKDLDSLFVKSKYLGNNDFLLIIK